jgi:hypothetical protein
MASDIFLRLKLAADFQKVTKKESFLKAYNCAGFDDASLNCSS